VAPVFGVTPQASHKAVSYLHRQQPGIAIWLFSNVQPAAETVAWCERVVVRSNAVALLVEAELALWPRWVVLCAGTWTGEPGPWLLKIAPFLIPPFRILLLNANGDLMPGDLKNLRSYWRHELSVKAKDLGVRARNVTAAAVLLALATLMRWAKYPHRRVFHKLHGDEHLCMADGSREDAQPNTVPFAQQGTGWRAQPLRDLVQSTGARWILWRSDDEPAVSVDRMLPLFDDERTFAVSIQSHARGWKSMLFATAPFRKLQAGEATRVLAPLSNTILVSRQKLAALGVPECELATTAWLLLFWKASAAGWLAYSIGREGPVSAEPEFPVQETAFILRVLCHTALRRLGPSESQLSRGNIAFRPSQASSRTRRERPRVLIVSPFVPYPLAHGGAVRIFHLCRALSDRVDFGLIAIREAGVAIDYAKLHDIFRNIRIVDLDEPESHNLHLPRQVRRHESSSLRALVADLCDKWKPDLLQIEYTHLAGLRDCAGGVPAILVEHDLTCGLYRQFADYEPSAEAEREYRRWFEFERSWLRVYEGVWAVSGAERDQAIRHGARSRDRTFLIPNGVDTRRFRPCESAASRSEILFVGSFRHWPNILAFEKLCYEIMPRVWAAHPSALLRVVAGPNHERFRDLLRPTSPERPDQRVEILGFVEDLSQLYARAAVIAAPLAISSGTNIKVLEAMACGKGIVSTPSGCAGLGLRDGHDVLIREDWDGFAGAVSALLTDAALRSQIGANARRTAEQHFDWDDIAKRAFESYLALLGQGEPLDCGTSEKEFAQLS
jgi:glycosyltransferase involved in cell wall biosynthesis